MVWQPVFLPPFDPLERNFNVGNPNPYLEKKQRARIKPMSSCFAMTALTTRLLFTEKGKSFWDLYWWVDLRNFQLLKVKLALTIEIQILN